MSFRHTMITQFFYEEDREAITELVQVFDKHFDSVEPFYSRLGRLRFIAIQSRDSDNFRVEENELPEVLKEAEGILQGELDIVVAWESENDKPRQRVFTIKGRGKMTRIEYLSRKDS